MRTTTCRPNLPKIRRIVTIRYMLLGSGERSVYFDIYYRGYRHCEFLRDDNGKTLRLIEETGTDAARAAIRLHNQYVMLRAEEGRIKKEREFFEYGLKGISKALHSYMPLDEWFDRYHGILDASKSSLAIVHHFETMRSHIDRWLGKKVKKIRMREIDSDWCVEFIKYLRQYTRESKTAPGKIYTLAPSTIGLMMQTLKRCMKYAVKEQVIAKSPVEDPTVEFELPQKSTKHGEFLTFEELRRLIRTECRNSQVRDAFLFSCNTGLRLSDIVNLTWANIVKDGEAYRLITTMQKTKGLIDMKLSDAALKYLPRTRHKSQTKRVFALPVITGVERFLKIWCEDAGIDKHITFHAARRTFATLTLNSGTDFYTVSKLLGHRSVRTTEVYVTLLKSRTDTAIDRLGQALSSLDG